MEYTQSASRSVRLLLIQVVAICILSSPVIFAATTSSIPDATSSPPTSGTATVTSEVTITTASKTSPTDNNGTTSEPPSTNGTTTITSTTTISTSTISTTAQNNTSNITTDSSTSAGSSKSTDSATTSTFTATGSFTTAGSSTTTYSSTTGSSTATNSSTTGSSTATNSSTTGSSTATNSSTTAGSFTGNVTASSPTTITTNASTITSSSTTTPSIPTTSTVVTTTSTQTSPASSVPMTSATTTPVSSPANNGSNGANGGVIAAIVILVIAIVVAVTLFVIFWKRRNQPWYCKTRTRYRSTRVPRKRMKMKYFAQYLGVLHKDSGLLFQEQFEELQKNSPRTYSYDAALTDENKIKNRYVNIVPYDHTRVKLTVDSEIGGSDFINASYVPGYSSPREYIATQGPLLGTADDFWRMMWEQKSGVIVMLSDLHEKGRRKVDKYWPDEANSPERYGDITVEMTSVTTCKCYTIRHFKISEDNQEERMVLQFFIPGWEDHGANLSPEDILSFIQAVRLEARTREGPITVHCSAGVGRTGTFIALDFLMQFVEDNNLDEEVDIYNLVLNMRHSRPCMVQSEKQYIFIHDVLKIIIDRKIKNFAGSNGVHDNLAFDPDEANGDATELCSTKSTSL